MGHGHYAAGPYAAGHLGGPYAGAYSAGLVGGPIGGPIGGTIVGADVHTTVTKHVGVPVPAPYPVAVDRPYPVAVKVGLHNHTFLKFRITNHSNEFLYKFVTLSVFINGIDSLLVLWPVIMKSYYTSLLYNDTKFPVKKRPPRHFSTNTKTKSLLFQVAVPVPVDRPYAVPVPKPYPVTVEKHVAVPVDRPVPYPVPQAVPYPVIKQVWRKIYSRT